MNNINFAMTKMLFLALARTKNLLNMNNFGFQSIRNISSEPFYKEMERAKSLSKKVFYGYCFCILGGGILGSFCNLFKTLVYFKIESRASEQKIAYPPIVSDMMWGFIGGSFMTAFAPVIISKHLYYNYFHRKS